MRTITSILLLFLAGQVASCASTPRLPAGTAAVRFMLSAPAASSVSVCGTFNRWDPERDRLEGPDRDGVWTVTLPIRSGTYEYLFFVNGREWVRDPAAPTADDGMGGTSSLLFVP